MVTSLGSVESEIVGGSSVASQHGGFVAALFEDFEEDEDPNFFLTCGGTFIAEDLVLTAASCSIRLSLQEDGNQQILQAEDPARFRVARRPESLAAIDPAELLEVESVYLHPDYDWNTRDNNIAIWKLKASSPGPVLQLASASETSDLESDRAKVKIFGYGRTDTETFETPDGLMKGNVQIVDFERCQATYHDGFEEVITPNMLCAGGRGKDFCAGDDGGPLTSGAGDNRRLVGVAALEYGCGAWAPSVYTRVANYQTWVDQCMAGDCPSLQPVPMCLSPYTDCDGDAANGCETMTLGASNCGACGAACASGEACVFRPYDIENTVHCAPAKPLKPRLECVYDPGDGSPRIASFGYKNENEAMVYVESGRDNRFFGVPGADTTFPGIVRFRPGRYGNAPVVFMGDGPARWRLTGPDGVTRQATAKADSKACATNPLEEIFEEPR